MALTVAFSACMAFSIAFSGGELMVILIPGSGLHALRSGTHTGEHLYGMHATVVFGFYSGYLPGNFFHTILVYTDFMEREQATQNVSFPEAIYGESKHGY